MLGISPVAELGEWLRPVVQNHFKCHAVPVSLASLRSIALDGRASAPQPEELADLGVTQCSRSALVSLR